MKKLDVALLLGLVIAVILSSVNAFAKDLEGISDGVLRLHILANSDSKEDQELKIKVRDAVLAETADLFCKGKTRLQVEQIALNSIDKIQTVAEKTIKENGYNYPVKCELTYMEFDDRTYGDITLPAGYYDALRITIGEAKGHNWWCVMYPQLCIAPSLDKESLKPIETSLEDESFKPMVGTSLINEVQKIDEDDKLKGFNDSEIKIMKKPQKYKIRFLSVKLFRQVKKALS